MDRKRPRANEPSQSNPPAKKAKLSRQSNFSPEFWDNLSRVWLTPRALRELDRRNKTTQPLRRVPVPELYPTQLARFARRGGPDLRHLRGYTEREEIADDMSSSRSSSSRSRQTRSTNATSVGTRTRSLLPTVRSFNNISPITETEYIAALLSPSQFTPTAFRGFKQRNAQAIFKKNVTRTIIPMFTSYTIIHNQQDVRFTELKPMTNEEAVKPQPDFFDGARLGDLSQKVRNHQAILSMGIPTKHPSVPVEPTFFLEYGARAMHALQNYRETEPLKLYAHHVTAPTTAEERPGYHMTQIGAYTLTNSLESFIKGATAFRNARESAKRHRDSFIQAANARAAQETPVIQEEPVETSEETSRPVWQYSPEVSTSYTAWQDADYAPQQQIAHSSENALPHDTGIGSTVPGHSYAQEDTPNPSQETAGLARDDPSMSFASSFTTFTTDPVQSKRPRDSTSPSSTSKRTHQSEGRTGSLRYGAEH
ncbi:hypothetical protein ED733_008866 [Metarhizium rileyi]|uniref:Uncharacterized protein n=1 Tax=Metarhizium rileyi (strain RCEF 4871) TaxID=1649241 RepID=A0A5C6GQ78_METRR|nr:hypothetical protein ED733_008866 [Metarhizium rileyi]